MLKITLTCSSNDCDSVRVTVFRVIDEHEVCCGDYRSTGHLANDQTFYDRHELVLNNSFDEESVGIFGRYGIMRLIPLGRPSDEYADNIFISGGDVASSEAMHNWLRLEQDDHRHLMFLVRKDPMVQALLRDTPSFLRESLDVANSDGKIAKHLTRLLKAAAVSPFLTLVRANAQCSTPTGGQNGSASGNGYSAINQSLIQNQEGGVSPGGVSPNGTGYGVTYYGLDLGQTSANTLTNVFHLPPSTVSFFSPLIGKTGTSAVVAYYSSPSFNTPPSTVQQQVYANVYPTYFAAAAASFNQLASSKGISTFQFSNMPMQWQTVTASMYFQAASPIPSINQKFMKTTFASQIVNGQYSAAYANLQNFNSPNVYQNQRAAANAHYLKNDGCTN